MTDTSLGVAIIITNDYEKSKLGTLKGTPADGDKMTKAFGEFFKFDCLRAKNLSGQGMMELVKKCAKCPSLKEKKCIVFVFSGHGNEGVIFGEDKEDIPIENIIWQFDPKVIPELKDIPKLFFIDACRGSEDTPTAGKAKWSGKGTIQDASKSGGGGDPDNVGYLSGGYILGYATMPGYKSYLRSDKESGSVWMPLLADELQRDPERDVLHVLVYVNTRLREEFEMEKKRIPDFHYQQPHFENTTEAVNLFRISGVYSRHYFN